MAGRIFVVLITGLLINILLPAQLLPFQNYPQQYFTWPVNAKKGLAANFGELRPNHYHMGLDCRTDQQENRPVLAAADGYIARVKIEPLGFGRCIYINHPNGLTTVYAHLNDFDPPLENYIKAQQYQLKSWKVFLDLPVNRFPVKKGQFIAFSGNTGGSQGPHLHFEIRDTRTDKVLNPLLFGFPIIDNIPPDVLRLAVYDRSKSTYEQAPKMYALRKVNGRYTTVPGIIVTDTRKVSFAITAYDRYTGSTNKNGISQATLYRGEEAVSTFLIDSISYDETRYINAHIDYRLRNSGGSYVQHLSRLPGYPAGVYHDLAGDGVIELEGDSAQSLRIEVKDAAGNTSVVALEMRSTAPTSLPGLQAASLLPDIFRPGFVNVFENDHLSFYLPEDALYDSIRFRYQEMTTPAGYTTYQLHNGNVPVHGMFPVRIRSSAATNPDKMVMHRYWQDKHDYAKAYPVTMGTEKNWYQSSFRAFGFFQLIADTLPPSITPVGFRDGMNAAKLNRIAFVIKDNTKQLENFSALLDGQWIRFTNDKGSTFIYKFDEHCPPGAHELTVSIEDCVGNRAERTYRFTR